MLGEDISQNGICIQSNKPHCICVFLESATCRFSRITLYCSGVLRVRNDVSYPAAGLPAYR